MDKQNCRRCGEELPPKEEQDCEHYKDNICCVCELEEADEAMLKEDLR